MVNGPLSLALRDNPACGRCRYTTERRVLNISTTSTVLVRTVLVVPPILLRVDYSRLYCSRIGSYAALSSSFPWFPVSPFRLSGPNMVLVLVVYLVLNMVVYTLSIPGSRVLEDLVYSGITPARE